LGLLLHKLKQLCCLDNSKEAQIPIAFYSLSSKLPFIITVTKLILTPEQIQIRQEMEQSTMSPELHKQWLVVQYTQLSSQLATAKFTCK